jgi:hypothetical protein
MSEDRDLVKTYLQDHRRYCRDVLKLRTKRGEIVPFELNHAQEVMQEILTEQRRQTGRVRAIVLKARQLGISSFVASRFYRRIHLTSNRRAVIIADKKDRSGALFGIYERFDKFLASELRPHKRSDSMTRHLIYDNKDGIGLGTELIVETAGDVDAGRAQTIMFLHASELAFWPNADLTWLSIAQAVPDEDSEVIIESTANGVGGVFHEEWERAENGESDYVPIFLPWFIDPEYRVRCSDEEWEAILLSEDSYERQAQDVGFPFRGEVVKLTPEQLKWRRWQIANNFRGDARTFKQEMPSIPEEAFLASGSCFFSEVALAKYRISAQEPKTRGELVPVMNSGALVVQKREWGNLKMWRWPARDGEYVIGADTASGRVSGPTHVVTEEDAERGGRDFSCAYVFNLTRRSYDASLHGRIDPDLFAEMLFNLGFFYTSPGPQGEMSTRIPAFLAVEGDTASGESVLRLLKDWGYPNLYYHHQVNRRTNRATPILGWRTSPQTRGPMLDELAADIREESVAILDPALIRECLTFTRGNDGKAAAQSGAHDDRVIAAAIALQMERYAPEQAKGQPAPVLVAATPTGIDTVGYEQTRALKASTVKLPADLYPENW